MEPKYPVNAGFPRTKSYTLSTQQRKIGETAPSHLSPAEAKPSTGYSLCPFLSWRHPRTAVSGHESVNSKGLEKAVLCYGKITFGSSCCYQRRCLKARKGIIGKKRTFESHGSLRGLLSPEDTPLTASS